SSCPLTPSATAARRSQDFWNPVLGWLRSRRSEPEGLQRRVHAAEQEADVGAGGQELPALVGPVARLLGAVAGEAGRLAGVLAGLQHALGRPDVALVGRGLARVYAHRERHVARAEPAAVDAGRGHYRLGVLARRDRL